MPLLFSEYGEGSSNNTFLEIYNPTSSVVSLDDYAFPSVLNAPSVVGVHDWSTFTAGATIAAGGVYVICHPISDAAILAVCDQHKNLFFNGDDGYCLAAGTEANHTILDCVGNFNGDPGAGWDVCGVAAGTRDRTLVRKFSVTAGNAGDWSMSAGTNATDCEWLIEPQGTWTHLGSHAARSPSPPPSPPSPPTPPSPPPLQTQIATIQSEYSDECPANVGYPSVLLGEIVTTRGIVSRVAAGQAGSNLTDKIWLRAGAGNWSGLEAHYHGSAGEASEAAHSGAFLAAFPDIVGSAIEVSGRVIEERGNTLLKITGLTVLNVAAGSALDASATLLSYAYE